MGLKVTKDFILHTLCTSMATKKVHLSNVSEVELTRL